MVVRSVTLSHFLLLLLWLMLTAIIINAKKVHIPDDLADVVDDEEDEEWKAWGKVKSKGSPVFDPPPDFANMDPNQIKAEILKRQSGPSMGFVKLRLDTQWKKEEVLEIVRKWNKITRASSMDAKFLAVDPNTLMFNVQRGEDVMEVKDFVLAQPEAYEFKLGDNAYRRPGDPPLEVVIEELQKKKKNLKLIRKGDLSNDDL